MVPHDVRRPPDPSEMLQPETVEALRSALADQQSRGGTPTDMLKRAIQLAAREARAKELHPEALLIQLKALSDEVGLRRLEDMPKPLRIREWMVSACLNAYWHTDEADG